MKKSLLTLGLLGLAGGAFAQTTNPNLLIGPWAVVNVAPDNINTPASTAIDQLVTLSPTFTWGIGYDATSVAQSPPKNASIRSNNAAGTGFDYTTIAGTTLFQPTNITVPFGVPNNTMAFCGQYATGASNGGGGEVIRSTNGGASWRRITTNAQFASPDGFCNWAYAFNQNEVVTGGDPNPVGASQFEFWYSTNAAAANSASSPVLWSRATTPAPLGPDEYALVGSYFALGNTIWAGTSNNPGMTPGPARVLKSTDKGHTWTVANTPMTGSVPNIVFKDPMNGVAYKPTASGIELMYTSNGGALWTMDMQTPDPTTADTVMGKLYRFGISAIPNIGFMSYGDAIPSSRRLVNRGASFSCSGHGKTWKDVDKMRATYVSADFLQVGTSRNYVGYLGGFTNPATPTNPVGGDGGIYQVRPTAGGAPVPVGTYNPADPCDFRIRTSVKNTELQRSLTVYPNPSANGVFQVQLADGIKAGTHLVVFDALGRQVLSRELSATAANSKSLNVDLSKEKAGVYTLRLTTAAGIATQKLVIQ